MIRSLYLRRKAELIDVGLVLIVLGPTIRWTTDGHPRGTGIALAFAQALPLLVRRRFPLPVLTAVLAALVATHFTIDVLPLFALGVAAYTVASHTERRVALSAALLTLLALSIPPIHHGGGARDSYVHAIIFASAAWILGDNVRTKRAYYRELEDRAERLEREQGEHARRAAAEEQARIARELHDVIAHSVSVMVVQATAANDVFDKQPERAREALRSIEESGRSALTELRRLLGVMRTSDVDRLEPQPGLAALESLVDQVRAAGLEVELKLDTDLGELPTGVDLSAYRIVQEALTNTLKHAQASQARVRVSRNASALELDISDDGAGSSEEAPEGHGLIGMRERAALLGGVLEAGPGENGGFAVRARFPLGQEKQA